VRPAEETEDLENSMPKTIIVSGATSSYYEVLAGLLASIRDSARRDTVDIGVFDLGLDPVQQAALAQQGLRLVEPQWHHDLRDSTAPGPGVKGMMARPHLSRYFPGYDVYVWLDADCWVQDWNAVRLYIEFAQSVGFAITPECYRGYSPFYASLTVAGFAVLSFRDCVDEPRATRLAHYPLINAGVFAGRADAPHWDAWSKAVEAALGRRPADHFFLDQTALNLVIRTAEFPTALLPARCNWMCNRALPKCSADGALLLESQPPFEPLGIIHLTGNTKDGSWPLKDQQGREHRRSLRFNAAIA
jgi:hypothetical protein